jgi:hypothetical protein
VMVPLRRQTDHFPPAMAMTMLLASASLLC